MTLLRTLRRLVLGETWALPVGVAASVAAAGVAREVAGPDAWFAESGGWLLLGLLAVAFAVAVLRSGRAS
ncbi:MAG TPA: hypothetical protein VFQ51_09925 [Vicinamibacteria bacterium]|nr:hypothetical protein [Vicinamibacteria bacterium]